MKPLYRLIVFSFLLVGAFACQRETSNLNALKQRMQAGGNWGEYRQANNTLEKISLNLIGVNDMLMYHQAGLKAFVFKEKEGKDPLFALDEAESFLKEYLNLGAEADGKRFEEIWQTIKSDAKVRGQFLLVCHGINQANLLRAFRLLF